jgi:maleylacetoacetate isomerase
MRLYGFWRSGATWRVRIALNLKGLAYDAAPVNLADGEQNGAAYRGVNSQGLVPTLEVEDLRIGQSLAIIEWLDEKFPTPPLLPLHADERAIVRGMALAIASDIHPLNNPRVQKVLTGELRADEAQISAWIARWITAGFDHVEAMIEKHGDGFAYGGSPTLADCCLIPQVASARRYGVDIGAYPRILAVDAAAAHHPAFVAARPDMQPGSS